MKKIALLLAAMAATTTAPIMDHRVEETTVEI
jgi:hypothetical protein